MTFTGLFKGREALKTGIRGQMSAVFATGLRRAAGGRGKFSIECRRVMSPSLSFLGGAGASAVTKGYVETQPSTLACPPQEETRRDGTFHLVAEIRLT
jgi:hypothetical protein